MTQPSVTITELDGALGILPPSAGRLFALLGVSSQGPTDTPATYARIQDIQSDFGYGPLVEAAAHHIEKYGRPVVLVRTGQTVAATISAVTFTGTGTSVVTVHAGTLPWDDYEFKVRVIMGGTIGVTGITFQYSLDGGRTYSPTTALGTAVFYIIPNSGGVRFNFAAGTLVAGDYWTALGEAPNWNGTEIGDALDALAASAVSWELAEIVGPIDATTFDVIDPKFSGMLNAGKYHAWVGSVRIPDPGESEATYLSSLSAAFATKATIFGELCAGACKLTSSVSGRKYRRPVSFAIASRNAFVSEEIDIADVNLGTLPGVAIRDANGNVDEHDESVNPGLDDARFTVLRTWDGVAGVFVNRPRIFSADGSDFRLMPHRRVLNIAHAALRTYFIRRLNQPVQVDATTGFILESEALEIESGARAVMRAALLAKPKASGIQFVLSRTDNLLSTQTMTGTARVIPLAYPEFIELSLGFLNPALQVVTV
jgi:hypothetical protein